MKRTIIALCATIIALSASAQFNFGSVNIRCSGKGDYKKNNGWDQRRDELCEIIRFEAFDVFGAQEVRHTQLKDMLERLPEYDYIGVGRDDGKEKGEYSPVFYRRDQFQKLDGGTFWLSETPDQVSKGWDGQCRRVCSWGKFKDKKSKTIFWFFNMHMDHRGKVARAEGAKLVVERVRQMAGANANIVITGDYNVTQSSAPYMTFRDCGFLKDSYEAAPIRLAHTGTFNSFNPNNWSTRRIDHIFVSKGAKVERFGILTYHYWLEQQGEDSELQHAPKEIRAEKRELKCPSDHYPLQAFVTFKKKK